MQQASQEAPKPQQTSQPQDFSPAQQAAIDIAGMIPENFVRFSPELPENLPPQTEQQKKNANTELLEASLQGKGKEYADDFISKFGAEAFIDTFGGDVYRDFYGALIPETPAFTFAPPRLDPEVMIPAEPAPEPATVDSTLQALRDELRDLLDSEGEGFFTDDELTAQAQQIQAKADEAATKLAQQMAMRGMGASGLAGAGFGGIAAQEFGELTDLAIQNKIAGDEQRRANIAAISGMLTALTGDETKKELFEMAERNRRTEQEVADSWNFLNDELGLSLGDKWDPASKASALEALYNGVPVYEVMRGITYEVRKDPATGNDISVAFYQSSPPTPEEKVAQVMSEAVADEVDGETSKDVTEDEWSQSFANMEDYEKRETMFMIFATGYEEPPPSAVDGMVYEAGTGNMVPYEDLPQGMKAYYWKMFWEDIGVDWRKYSNLYYKYN